MDKNVIKGIIFRSEDTALLDAPQFRKFEIGGEGIYELDTKIYIYYDLVTLNKYNTHSEMSYKLINDYSDMDELGGLVADKDNDGNINVNYDGPKEYADQLNAAIAGFYRINDAVVHRITPKGTPSNPRKPNKKPSAQPDNAVVEKEESPNRNSDLKNLTNQSSINNEEELVKFYNESFSKLNPLINDLHKLLNGEGNIKSQISVDLIKTDSGWKDWVMVAKNLKQLGENFETCKKILENINKYLG